MSPSNFGILEISTHVITRQMPGNSASSLIFYIQRDGVAWINNTHC